MKKTVVKVEVEICYDPDADAPIEFENERDIVEHFASCVIGNDFASVSILYEGEEF
tara:strand:+ start:65300 stop:65467 length:168 start_codon:yes stop_codon:yes gene_type:complete